MHPPMIAVGSDDNNPSGGGKCQVFEYNDSTRWVFMNQKEKKHTVKSCISLFPIFIDCKVVLTNLWTWNFVDE